jgi:hypothetical protein
MNTQSQEMQEALNRLELEFIHFRNTGIGKQFLFDAIENLLRVDREEFIAEKEIVRASLQQAGAL